MYTAGHSCVHRRVSICMPVCMCSKLHSMECLHVCVRACMYVYVVVHAYSVFAADCVFVILKSVCARVCLLKSLSLCVCCCVCACAVTWLHHFVSREDTYEYT